MGVHPTYNVSQVERVDINFDMINSLLEDRTWLIFKPKMW